jgi:hypothetical protein
MRRNPLGTFLPGVDLGVLLAELEAFVQLGPARRVIDDALP